jgi:hypothetical protein
LETPSTESQVSYTYVKDRGSGELELYDLKRDVGGTKKLAKEQPEVVAVLLKLAQAFEWPEKLIGNAIALPKAPKGK